MARPNSSRACRRVNDSWKKDTTIMPIHGDETNTALSSAEKPVPGVWSKKRRT
jgi:hypothetical protein